MSIEILPMYLSLNLPILLATLHVMNIEMYWNKHLKLNKGGKRTEFNLLPLQTVGQTHALSLSG